MSGYLNRFQDNGPNSPTPVFNGQGPYWFEPPVSRAKAEAEGILNDYKKEAEAYKSLVQSTGLGFTTEGFLSYMGVRVIEDAKNPVYIGMQAPAKTNWMNST